MQWLEWMSEAGLPADGETDPWRREVFIGAGAADRRRPRSDAVIVSSVMTPQIVREIRTCLVAVVLIQDAAHPTARRLTPRPWS